MKQVCKEAKVIYLLLLSDISSQPWLLMRMIQRCYYNESAKSKMLPQKCRIESWEWGCGLYMGVGTRGFQGHEIIPPSVAVSAATSLGGGIRPLGGGGSSSCSAFYEQQDPVFSVRWDGNQQALYLYADICWSPIAGVIVQVNLFFQVLPFLSAAYKQSVLRAISLPRWCHQHRTNPLCFS